MGLLGRGLDFGILYINSILVKRVVEELSQRCLSAIFLENHLSLKIYRVLQYIVLHFPIDRFHYRAILVSKRFVLGSRAPCIVDS